MSQQSRRELVDTMRDKYLQARRAEKIRMLDYLVAVTGFHRKHANRVLVHGYKPSRDRRGRKRKYSGSVVSALVTICRICGCICGKRLQPFLPEMVTVLERHDELVLDEETRRLLLQMSAATIDRKLKSLRHSFAKNLADAGTPFDEVATVLGHESLDTTRIYTQSSGRDLECSVQRVAGEIVRDDG